MGFITKNANIILLFLIMLSAASLVGATVFFQMNFEKINAEYNQKLKQLQVVSQQLEQEQTMLDKIKSELNVKSEREQQLGEKFTEVKTNKEQLETQKKQLETTTEQLQTELQSTNSQLNNAQADVETKKIQIDSLSRQNVDLTANVNVCQRQRDDYKQAKDDCVTAKAACTCP